MSRRITPSIASAGAMSTETMRAEGVADSVPIVMAGGALPDGRSLVRAINAEVQQKFPHKFLVAEDIRRLDEVTAPIEHGLFSLPSG